MPKPIYVLSDKQKAAYARDGRLLYTGVPAIGSPKNFLRYDVFRNTLKPMIYGTRRFDDQMRTIGTAIEKAFPNVAGKIGRKLFDGVVKESAGRGVYHIDKIINGDFDKDKKELGGQSTLAPNIIRGGKAIDLGNNLYYIQGRKHKQGGVDVGKDLEVEGGEVMQVKPNEVRVFSSVPLLRGSSPAQLVMGGANPNQVFNAQEEFKDRNKIKDDGSRYRNGGNKYITKLSSDEEIKFKNWYSKLAKYKNLNPNPDAKGQDYDYRGYWKNEDREGILGSNPNAHFIDKYKQPSHPTFSNESIYSNNKTPGGQWVVDKTGTWLFKHNNFTTRQALKTHNYLLNSGEGYILGNDTIIPQYRCGGVKRKKAQYGKRKYIEGQDYELVTDSSYMDIPSYILQDSINKNKKQHDTTNYDYEMVYPDGFPDMPNASVDSLKNYINNRLKDNNKKEKNVRRYVYNPNLIDIPQMNIGNIGTYFYTPKSSEPARREGRNSNNSTPTYTPVQETITPQQQIMINAGNKAYSTALRNSTRPSLASLARTTELTRIPTIPGIASPETYQTKTKNKFWKAITPEDYIGLGSNVLGSIIGGILGSRNKKLPYIDLGKIEKPLTVSAAKLKTDYNINPQLADIDEREIRGISDIDRNTQSSQVALARKQRLRNATQSAKNQLYGQKENIETELINRDAINRQQVRMHNAASFNQYLRDVHNNRLQQLENNRRTDLYNAEIDMRNFGSWINTISGINASIQDTLQRLETRKAQERTLKAVAARNPDAKKVMDVILKNLI